MLESKVVVSASVSNLTQSVENSMFMLEQRVDQDEKLLEIRIKSTKGKRGVPAPSSTKEFRNDAGISQADFMDREDGELAPNAAINPKLSEESKKMVKGPFTGSLANSVCTALQDEKRTEPQRQLKRRKLDGSKRCYLYRSQLQKQEQLPTLWAVQHTMNFYPGPEVNYNPTHRTWCKADSEGKQLHISANPLTGVSGAEYRDDRKLAEYKNGDSREKNKNDYVGSQEPHQPGDTTFTKGSVEYNVTGHHPCTTVLPGTGLPHKLPGSLSHFPEAQVAFYGVITEDRPHHSSIQRSLDVFGEECNIATPPMGGEHDSRLGIQLENGISTSVANSPLVSTPYYKGTDSSRYNQQVIAVLESQPEIEKAAHYLYQKHNTTSYVVKWDEVSHIFERVDWNIITQRYERASNQDPLPINPGEWRTTRIQAVGHGDINLFNTQAASIAGFSPEDLAEELTSKISVGEDVGRISIVGCTRKNHLGSTTTTPVEKPAYLIRFMDKLKQLGRSNTEVSLRSGLVSVDQRGRKLTGELVLAGGQGSKSQAEVGVEWRHKNPSRKWIGRFTSATNYCLQQTNVAPNDMESHFFGILPPDSELYVFKNNLASLSAYTIDDSTAFEWIDQIAQNIYSSISKMDMPEANKSVQFLTGEQRVQKIGVREINGMNDLLMELHRYGGKNEVSCVYYRFGDWVLSMNPSTFYVSVEGVIISSTDSAAKKSRVARLLAKFRTFPNQRIPMQYREMQLHTGADFFDNVRSWIGGRHQEIGLNIENAYNAQCGTAMFLSESIRCFQNHITNMMSLDLERHGYLSKEYFFNSHPMGRGGTWQIRTGQDEKMTGLNMLHYVQHDSSVTKKVRKAIKVLASTKSRISRICKSWLSRVETPELKGSRFRPPQSTPIPYIAQTDMLASIENIGAVNPHSKLYLRDYDLREATSHLLSKLSL